MSSTPQAQAVNPHVNDHLTDSVRNMLEREGVLKLTESKSVTAHRDADGIKVSASALLFRVVPPVTTAAPEDEEYEKVSISRPTNEHIMFEGKTLQSVVGEMKRHRHIA